jgi:hypothetical protein
MPRLSGNSRFPSRPNRALARSRILHRIGAALFLALPIGVVRDAASQSQQAPQFPSPAPTSSTHLPPFDQSNASDDPMLRHAQIEAAKRRNAERQIRMVSDAERIVELAQQLSADTAAESKAPSPAMTKKAEEIEKLAKSVRDRMIGE